MRVTTAGREESHPHDVTITNEAPNYQRSLNPVRHAGQPPVGRSPSVHSGHARGPTRPRVLSGASFKRSSPPSPPLALAAAPPSPAPVPTVPVVPAARGPTSSPTTAAEADDGRCAIDAEAYFRDYQSSVDDALPTTMAMPAGAPAAA